MNAHAFPVDGHSALSEIAWRWRESRATATSPRARDLARIRVLGDFCKTKGQKSKAGRMRFCAFREAGSPALTALIAHMPVVAWHANGTFDDLYIPASARQHLLLRTDTLAHWTTLVEQSLRTPPPHLRFMPAKKAASAMLFLSDVFHPLLDLFTPSDNETSLLVLAYHPWRQHARYSTLVPGMQELSGMAHEAISSARAAAKSSVRFELRRPIVFYRGSMSASCQRQLLVSLLPHFQLLNRGFLNVTGGPVPIRDAVKYRFHLHMGGTSGTSSGSLRWKLASGSLVFKVRCGSSIGNPQILCA